MKDPANTMPGQNFKIQKYNGIFRGAYFGMNLNGFQFFSKCRL